MLKEEESGREGKRGGGKEGTYRRFNTISGAKYSGVPQNVFVNLPPSIPPFASPKSTSLTCPRLSIKIFSGFKSRKMVFFLFKYDRTAHNSLA